MAPSARGELEITSLIESYLAEGSLTVTDVLAGPPGTPGSTAIRRLCTAIVLVSLLAYVAAQFQGAGKTFHQTFAMSMPAAVLLGGGIIVLYTLLGGFWAVSITDTLQGLVMAGAAVIVPVMGVGRSLAGDLEHRRDQVGSVVKPGNRRGAGSLDIIGRRIGNCFEFEQLRAQLAELAV